ncbi:flagellar basal body P-ring formation chaperone FlgA [Hydrogenivirga sp.]
MRCSPRLLTYVVSILFTVAVAIGGVIDEITIRRLAEEELEKAYDGEVQLIQLRTYIRKPVEFVRIERKVLNVRRGYPRGSFHLYLKTDRGSRRLSATLDLRWRCSLLVAQEDIGRGERVYPWQVTWEERFMGKCPQQGIRDVEGLINYVALRDIKKEEPVNKSYLKKEPMIRRGEEVDVVFRKGNLEISFRGKALDTGFYGDTIRVKSLNTGKILRGKVVSENSVILK